MNNIAIYIKYFVARRMAIKPPFRSPESTKTEDCANNTIIPNASTIPPLLIAIVDEKEITVRKTKAPAIMVALI